MVSGVDKSLTYWLVNISPITVGFMVDIWLVGLTNKHNRGGATEEIHLVFWWKKAMIVGWLWGWTILGMIGWDESYGGWKKSCTIGGLSHYLQAFYHPRWCRISSIHSIWSIFGGMGWNHQAVNKACFGVLPFQTKPLDDAWSSETLEGLEFQCRRFGISVSMIFYVPIV